MPKDVVLFDAFGYELTLPKAPDTSASQAAIGRVVDRWSGRISRDVTPESLAMIARPSTPLQEHMALCDKIYVDGHFLSIASDRAATAAGYEWDVLPFTDAPDSTPKAADRRLADLVGEALDNASGLEQYFEHLAWGDGLYPFTAAETIWDPSTYMPARFELPDATRFNWEARLNSARLLTDANPRDGEPLKPGNWTLHSANPTNPRKSRLYRALAFYYMVARFAIIDWLSFSEKYGKPIPVAYFEDPNDRDSLIEAVMNIGTEFAGVLPKSAKLDLIQALNATKDIQEGLAQFALDQSTKAACGHALIVDSKSGTGTLAGAGAQLTNLKVARGVAKRMASSVKQGLIRPLVYFHAGANALARLPKLQFKTNPAEDQQKKAATYVSWNEALAPVNLAIDPEHIKEVAGIPNLVTRTMAVDPSAAPAAPATAGDPAAATQQRDRRMRPTAQSDTPKIRTLTDVIAASTMLGTKAASDQTRQILDLARQAVDDGLSLAEFRDHLIEQYDSFDHSTNAETTAQAMAVAEAIGRVDEAEGRG